ncbi:MAG: hypothetical protein EPO13_02040 [Actinomycetota bacterium]|nr:MAG: hypothetical protein EPO13_02040 [Actinomycetota bacterium]
MPITYLDPDAGPPHETHEYQLRLAGDGAVRIGLLANGFPDSTAFLQEVQAAIGAHQPDASFVLYTKPRLGTSLTPDEIGQHFGDCDALVVAIGHCGSCTAASTRDAVTIAGYGLPVVLLVTEVFHPLAAQVAFSLGLTGLPQVVLPHPLAGTGLENLRVVATKFSPEILSDLRGLAA